MIDVRPIVLEGGGIRLEPLTEDHHDALAAAAADGRLWELWFIAVPPPDGMRAYVADALQGQRDGHMLPWPCGIWRAALSSARRVITTSFAASIAWRSGTPGMRRAVSGRTSTRPASCSCSGTRSTRSGARS